MDGANVLVKIPMRWRVIAGLLVGLVAYSLYLSLTDDNRLREARQCIGLDNLSDEGWARAYPDTTKEEARARCE